MVAKLGAKRAGDQIDLGCILVYPGHHVLEFKPERPALMGKPHPAAPLLLDREVMRAGSRMPILGRLWVHCPGCSQWVALAQLGVSGLCLVCRPPARATCRECSRAVRSDQVVGGRMIRGQICGGTCLICLPLGKILELAARQPSS